ncbi:hypothetical protein BGZ88_005744, partial [Linnemannia elongata]
MKYRPPFLIPPKSKGVSKTSKQGSLTKSKPRLRNKSLFIGLYFFLVLFVLALQVEWVPYLNTYSSKDGDTVVLDSA